MSTATDNAIAATVAEPIAGAWLRNPATGEIAHLLSVDESGRRLEVELWLLSLIHI